MNRSIWLPILAIIGLVCLGLGIYLLFRDTPAPGRITQIRPPSVSSPQNSPRREQRFQPVRVTVPATTKWFDTGLDVTDKNVSIKYVSGAWRNHPTSGTNAGEGRPYDEQNQLIFPNAPLSSLIGRTETRIFLVGSNYSGKPGVGRLYLSINDKEGDFADNSGQLVVDILVK